jgi:hypothetical protein
MAQFAQVIGGSDMTHERTTRRGDACVAPKTDNAIGDGK